MFSLWFIISIAIIAVETAILILGKEQTKTLLTNCFDHLSNSEQVSFNHCLSEAESVSFGKEILCHFFRTTTLTSYELSKEGWLTILYTVNDMTVQDRDAVKQALCLELHTYFLTTRGVDFWSFYVPILTEDSVMLRIAASPLAEKDFQSLAFKKTLEKDTPLVEEE